MESGNLKGMSVPVAQQAPRADRQPPALCFATSEILPAAQGQRCDQSHGLFRLLADVDRMLDDCINHDHPATADSGCVAAGPGPWSEHCRTGGLNHPAAG